MSMSDPIADMLTRIRNAKMAGQTKVLIPSSKLKEGIAEVLRLEGYISGFEVNGDSAKKEMNIALRRTKYGQNVINSIQRVSKPSRRIYKKADEVSKFKNGLGIGIYSTSSGIMSDRMARKNGVGGELICTVW